MLTNNIGARSPSAAHLEGLAAGVSAVFAAEVQTACATKQREGRAKDRTACREAFIGGEPCVFGMVAEGLGSTQVVDWVHVNALPTFVHFAGHDPSATSMLRAGQQTFAALHQEALRMVPETGRSGCTLTLCAINRTRSELTTINIGACAAVLFARDRVTRLTDDHRIQVNAQEQERLKASGILVSRAQDELGAPVGALRAWPGGLLCARALGRVGPAFVLPRPSCSSIVIPREFIRCDVLICSDGVWDELLVSAVHAIALSCPSATSAAQLVVSSAAAQHHLVLEGDRTGGMDVDVSVDVQPFPKGHIHRVIDFETFEVVKRIHTHCEARCNTGEVAQAGARGTQYVTNFVAATGGDELHIADGALRVDCDVGRSRCTRAAAEADRGVGARAITRTTRGNSETADAVANPAVEQHIAPMGCQREHVGIAQATIDGGYPPLMLQPVDFAAMFMQNQEKAQQAH
jgi:serine/threonine protein phosphatase PrpC